MEFTGADQEQVARMQVVVAKAIRPFAQNTEAAVAIAALMRNVRTLVRLYPPERQGALIDAMKLYLEGGSPDEIVLPFDIRGGGGRLIS